MPPLILYAALICGVSIWSGLQNHRGNQIHVILNDFGSKPPARVLKCLEERNRKLVLECLQVEREIRSFRGSNVKHRHCLKKETRKRRLQCLKSLRVKLALERAYNRCSPSVVRVFSNSGLGSGVVLDSLGHIVTNAHVVADGTGYPCSDISPTIRFFNSSLVSSVAKVVGCDAGIDLAILKVPASRKLPAPMVLSKKSFVLGGQNVLAIGNPGEAFVNVWTTGTTRPKKLDGPIVLLGTSIAVYGSRIGPGYSGGPVLNLQGQLLGINKALVAKQVALAIPVSVVRKFYKKMVGRRLPPVNRNYKD